MDIIGGRVSIAAFKRAEVAVIRRAMRREEKRRGYRIASWRIVRKKKKKKKKKKKEEEEEEEEKGSCATVARPAAKAMRLRAQPSLEVNRGV
jgi:hypothetical protein